MLMYFLFYPFLSVPFKRRSNKIRLPTFWRKKLKLSADALEEAASWMFPLRKESMERDSRSQVTLEIRMQQPGSDSREMHRKWSYLRTGIPQDSQRPSRTVRNVMWSSLSSPFFLTVSNRQPLFPKRSQTRWEFGEHHHHEPVLL